MISVDENSESENTWAARAMARVQDDILSGVLEPGSRLITANLAKRYGLGLTPLREGLTRLIARGLVVITGQRGFSVAPTTFEDFQDLMNMRELVECDALRRAMLAGGDEWEAAILSSLHRLRLHVQRQGAEFNERDPTFDRLHKELHATLSSACGSKRLLSAQADLYDQSYRYRMVRMKEMHRDTSKFIAEHERLVQLVIGRRHDEAKELLVRHLRSLVGYLYPDAAGSDERSC